MVSAEAGGAMNMRDKRATMGLPKIDRIDFIVSSFLWKVRCHEMNLPATHRREGSFLL
jgi:hypothetical protein